MTAQWNFDPDNPAPADAGYFGMDVPVSEARVICYPIPFEATTSYGQGTALGPEAIRRASHQMDFFDKDLGRPYEAGIASYSKSSDLAGQQFYTWLDSKAERCKRLAKHYRRDPKPEALNEIDEIGRELTQKSRDQVLKWLKQEKIVGLIGGDHSVALGSMLAAIDHEPSLGVLHLDAHADLRVAYEDFQYSHASVMHNVLEQSELKCLVSFGIRDFSEAEFNRGQTDKRIHSFFAEDIDSQLFSGESFDSVAKSIIEALPENVYLSFDIDGLDPTLCPNTGTPVAGGLQLAQIFHVLKVLTESGRKIIAFDLVEVAPADETFVDEWDGNVAARLIYKMIGHALKSRGVL